MADDRYKVSGELFRGILARMDSLTRAELMELRAERKELRAEHCSPAFFHVVLALGDIAGAELINRDLMGGSGNRD
jgi:hypothetical protein